VFSCHAECVKSGASEDEITSSKEARHPKLVEGSCAEALPAMLPQAQHDIHF
jgi:hypothetical protein